MARFKNKKNMSEYFSTTLNIFEYYESLIGK